MLQDSAQSTVLAFNDCITRRDIDGLASLMTNDHVFIDTEGNLVARDTAANRTLFGDRRPTIDCASCSAVPLQHW
jgi:ketosteroid isomerase-like protein